MNRRTFTKTATVGSVAMLAGVGLPTLSQAQDAERIKADRGAVREFESANDSQVIVILSRYKDEDDAKSYFKWLEEESMDSLSEDMLFEEGMEAKWREADSLGIENSIGFDVVVNNGLFSLPLFMGFIRTDNTVHTWMIYNSNNSTKDDVYELIPESISQYDNKEALDSDKGLLAQIPSEEFMLANSYTMTREFVGDADDI